MLVFSIPSKVRVYTKSLRVSNTIEPMGQQLTYIFVTVPPSPPDLDSDSSIDDVGYSGATHVRQVNCPGATQSDRPGATQSDRPGATQSDRPDQSDRPGVTQLGRSGATQSDRPGSVQLRPG